MYVCSVMYYAMLRLASRYTLTFKMQIFHHLYDIEAVRQPAISCWINHNDILSVIKGVKLKPLSLMTRMIIIQPPLHL